MVDLHKSKLFQTVAGIRKTAKHHYGDNYPFNVIKLINYSLFKINWFVLYGIDLLSGLPDHDLDPEFVVLKPTIEEFRLYKKGLNLPREFYYDEMHNVRNAYLVLHGKDIAYIHWVYLKGDPNRFLVLSEKAAELNYNTTIPKYRGKNLMSKMMRYINLDLKSQGFKKSYGVVHINNIPAIKSMERAGFKTCRYIKSIGPFNIKVSL